MIAELSVEDVMTGSVQTVDRTASIREVAGRFAVEGIGSLVVVEHGTPIGIVTDTDLVAVLGGEGMPAEVAVEDVMSTPLVTVDAEATVEEAVETLRSEGITKLPVLHNGTLAGIVTTTDLSYYLPSLVRRSRVSRQEGDRVTVSDTPELTYEKDDWTWSYESADDTTGIGVGDVVQFAKPLTADDVNGFAEATGDTNRVHLDAAFAERTRFGGQIAHGLLTAGWISAALARIPGLTIYLSQDLSFLAPVQVGADVRAVCRFHEQLGSNRFGLTTTVFTGDGSRCIEGDATVLIEDLPS